MKYDVNVAAERLLIGAGSNLAFYLLAYLSHSVEFDLRTAGFLALTGALGGLGIDWHAFKTTQGIDLTAPKG